LESLSIATYNSTMALITILIALFSIHRSLILLVMEAGIDIDLATLKLVGTRGFLIALVGSLLPIGIGMLLAWVMQVGDTTAIIAAGAVFGPTSLGIALNILKGGGVLNT
jgi:Kef-type K+ transport system membrane component KefB